MPAWIMRVAQALLNKKKILMIIASVVLAVIAAVFGISPAEIKEAVKDAPVLELPIVTTTVPSGK